ncbi:MAG: 4-alpha-glucanotransferase, partial [Actinobacteria bacterium]|nr:4-alpha-glucanotransferase [Actinomycetota bacterium]
MPDGSAAARSLGALARAYGVWRSYEDAHHRRHWISRRSLLGVLSGLGAPVETLADVPDALRARHRELWERVVEPVAVAWEGRLPSLEVRVPARLAEAPVLLRIEPEEDGPGDPVRVRLGPEEAPVARAVEVDGAGFVSRTARPSLPRPLPLGYHRLEVSVGRTSATATVVAAPRRAPDGGIEREWGVFLPLHALHTRRSWGVGDLSDLQELAGWVGE